MLMGLLATALCRAAAPRQSPERLVEPALGRARYARAGVPLVPPTSAVCQARGLEANDALICIARAGGRDRQAPAHPRSTGFKTRAEMAALFSICPSARPTIEIAQRCSFPVRGPGAGVAAFFRRAGAPRSTRRGAAQAREPAGAPDHDSPGRPAAPPSIPGTLQFELKYRGNEIPGLLLIVYDSSNGRRSRHSGRRAGFGAATLVSYSLTITITTRCASICCSSASSTPSGVSMPDFRHRFCQEPERRGHRLRAEPAKAATVAQSSILRHPAGAAGAARLRPACWNAYGTGRQVLQVVPQKPANR